MLQNADLKCIAFHNFEYKKCYLLFIRLSFTVFCISE